MIGGPATFRAAHWTEAADLHQRARQGLGFLTEERCVFMQLTGWQNLKLGRGRPDRALAFFPELEEHLDKPVGLLSGGQQQMLALGRLLTAVRAAADQGVAVILAEQHVRQALAIADRVHVLRRGRIVMSGDAADLRDPASGGAEGIAAHYLTGQEADD